MSTVLKVGGAVLLLLLSYYAGKSHCTIVTEEVVVRDTVTVDRPVESIRYVDRTETVYVAVVDTVNIWTTLHDTTYITLPREVAEYRDSNYYAKVSGISPQLDYIEIYSTTSIINSTKMKPKLSFSVGVGAAAIWSPFSGKIDAGPGIYGGLSYNF